MLTWFTDNWNPMPHCPSVNVREQTAELANFALSDYGTTPPRVLLYSSEVDSDNDDHFQAASSSHQASDIQNNDSMPTGEGRRGAISSYLTHLFCKHPLDSKTSEDAHQPPIAAVPYEHDPLLPKYHTPNYLQGEHVNSVVHNSETRRDPEGNRSWILSAMASWLSCQKNSSWNFRNIRNLNPGDVWNCGIVEPAKYLPAVMLGLLLNVLDGLSYGKKFPFSIV